MAHHPLKKETLVEFDGTTYALIFEIGAIAEAERIMGRSLILGLTQQLLESPTTDEVCAMFYAAAKPLQPKLTIEAVRQLLNKPSFQESHIVSAKMRNAVLEAWMAGAAEPKADDNDENPTLGQS